MTLSTSGLRPRVAVLLWCGWLGVLSFVAVMPATAQLDLPPVARTHDAYNGKYDADTLRRRALMSEWEAAAIIADFQPSGDGPFGGTTDEERWDAVVRQEGYLTARAEALPYWVALLRRYPESRHVPQALFHAGQLSADVGDAKRAAALFEQLGRDFPNSAWTGDANIWLIDAQLEREFDLSAARRIAETAIARWNQIDPAKARKARGEMAGQTVAGLRTWREVGRDLETRLGLIDFLERRPTAAARQLTEEKGKVPKRNPFGDDGEKEPEKGLSGFELARHFAPKQDFAPKVDPFAGPPATPLPSKRLGVRGLIWAARSGKVITPEEALVGDSQTRLLLMQADMYQAAGLFTEALALCDRIVSDDDPSISTAQRSWAYRLRGRCLHKHEDFREAALSLQHAARLGHDMPWWLATKEHLTAIYLYEFDDEDKVIGVYREIIAADPESAVAVKYAYRIGWVLEVSGRLNEAREVYQKFIVDNPESIYVEPIREHHLAEIEKAIAAEKSRDDDSRGGGTQ